MRSQKLDETLNHLDKLLSRPQQVWLLGAGISRNAGVPLMYPLTERIEEILEGEHKKDFSTIRKDLDKNAHVEHVLNHIGDLMALAGRARNSRVPLGETQRSQEALQGLHSEVQKALRNIIRWGYVPPENKDGDAEIGSESEPIISVDNHLQFVRALFEERQAGLESRPPIALFTTNYDTLLEDALALCRVRVADGFSGGATAFWDPASGKNEYEQPFVPAEKIDAKLYKLHGSVDWFESDNEVVVRRRERGDYSGDDNRRLLVYPQATKYMSTQRQPFAQLFQAFRQALSTSSDGIVCVCGYGFGDEHINQEIRAAFARHNNKLTLVAFVEERKVSSSDDESPDEDEDETRLPKVLEKWLSEDTCPWHNRVVVVTDSGFYHGSLDPRVAWDVNLWTFEGLTEFLAQGPQLIDESCLR